MNTLNLTDTLTSATTLTFTVADYALFKAWYRDIKGFDAYDAAKWAQRTMRGLNGDRTALSQLEDAGFALTIN